MNDPYKTLGMSPRASAAEIKASYRKLAKELHPDTHPDDAKIADRFKEVSAAYDILGDAKKRTRYDRGEIDATGQERAGPRFRRQHAGAGADGTGFGGFGGFTNPFGGAEDLFSQLFSGRRGKAQPFNIRGADQSYSVNIAFLDAAKGGTRRLTLADGRTLDVNIPPGIGEGQSIRLKEQGSDGAQGGRSGDALLKVHIVPHPFFTRDHDNVHVDLPVTLKEAVLGAKVKVPTIDGPVTMTVPKGSNSGKTLRLKGRGVRHGRAKERGDQFVTLIVTLPDQPDAELEKFAAEWQGADAADIRRDMLDT